MTLNCFYAKHHHFDGLVVWLVNRIVITCRTSLTASLHSPAHDAVHWHTRSTCVHLKSVKSSSTKRTHPLNLGTLILLLPISLFELHGTPTSATKLLQRTLLWGWLRRVECCGAQNITQVLWGWLRLVQACRVVRYGTITVCTVRTVLVELRRTTMIVTPYFTVITVK